MQTSINSIFLLSLCWQLKVAVSGNCHQHGHVFNSDRIQIVEPISGNDFLDKFMDVPKLSLSNHFHVSFVLPTPIQHKQKDDTMPI